MDKGQVLSTPQGIIWEHISSFKEILSEIDNTDDEKKRKRKSAICLHLSVLIVETFLNMYFRLLVEDDEYVEHQAEILKNLKNRKSLDYKIKNWPNRLFGKSLDFASGIAKDFIDLKERRNSIMHYKYTWDSVSTGNTEIKGLTDISFYESLNRKKAQEYFTIMQGTIKEILRLSGEDEVKLPFALQRWTGLITW